MKELSIEEKAKAYDEAIAKANEYLNSPRTCFDIEQLCNIFPELEESEDDKIRKALIEHFNFSDKNVYYEINGIPHKKVIAWLEKQGQTFTKKDVDDAYLKGICDAKHELEKQGEQKPTDEEMIALLHTEYEKGRADAIAEMQKPWSEEDERKIELLKSLIEDAKGDSTSYSTMFREMEELNNWLKSLKDRVLPQSRQEWSEEDESMLTRCIGILGKCYIGELPTKVEEELNWLKYLSDRVQLQPKQEWSEDDENRINRLIAYFEDKESFTAEDDIVYANWFKSLKDRYTWKPSEEQIKAVRLARSFVTDDFDENPTLSDVLIELERQLKKLREE